MDVIHLKWAWDNMPLCTHLNPWNVRWETVATKREEVNCPYCKRIMKER